MSESSHTPTIILINPQMGENIGAAARVMKNFGLSELRIVAPRDGWPNPKAIDMAAKAFEIVEQAAIYTNTADAIADQQRVFATTNRERHMTKPVLTPRELFGHPETAAKEYPRTAILFGPERTGLANEDIALADAILTIPTNPIYPSLNLAQAVAVVGYEWFQSMSGSPLAGEPKRDHVLVGGNDITDSPHQLASGSLTPPQGGSETPLIATKAELHGLFDQLESALDEVNFWRVEGKKPIMWRNIRSVYQRAQLTTQDIRTLRGMIRALYRG
jgi:tRNA/rRNA methyltransferase